MTADDRPTRPPAGVWWVVCFSLFWPLTSAAQQPGPKAETATLEERVKEIHTQQPLPSHARLALEQAERALSRSKQLHNQGKANAAERATGIAEAALTLAERRLAQARALSELHFVERRAKELVEDLTREKQALTKERARVEALRQAFQAQKQRSDAAQAQAGAAAAKKTKERHKSASSPTQSPAKGRPDGGR